MDPAANGVGVSEVVLHNHCVLLVKVSDPPEHDRRTNVELITSELNSFDKIV